MAFPTTLPSYIVTSGAETAGGAAGGTGLSPLLNAFETDITALGTKMGTGAATPSAGKVLRASGSGTSTWGAANLTTDVTGTLPTANGGTGLTAAGTSGNVLTSDGTNWTSTASSSVSALTLLHAGSGTTTTASAEDLSSFAISGLTVLDTLKVFYVVTSTTQSTSPGGLRSTTDSNTFFAINQTNTIAAGTSVNGEVSIKCAQGAATEYHSQGIENVGSNSNYQNFAGWISTRNKTLTTAFTGSWTMALRQEGVTSGGTYSYTWSIYKMAGQ